MVKTGKMNTMYLVSNFEPMPQFLHFLGYIIIMDLNIYFQVIILGHQVNHRREKIFFVAINCWWEIVLHKKVFQIPCLAKNVMICQICMTILIGQGPNLTGPDLPHQWPNLPQQQKGWDSGTQFATKSARGPFAEAQFA